MPAEATSASGSRSHADLVYSARIGLLKARIDDEITQPAAESVTPGDVDAYVAAHPREEPERRTIRVVRATTATQARQALRRLGSGMTWRLAQRRYGSEAGSTRRTVEPGTYPRKVEAAMFAATPKQLSRYATYVFEVTKIIKSHATPMNVQRAAAWEVLAGERQQEALDRFEQEFAAKWRARTDWRGAIHDELRLWQWPQPARV